MLPGLAVAFCPLKPWSQCDLISADACATGSWVDGHQEGQGTCQYATGMLYEGHWRKGLRRVTSRSGSHPDMAGSLQGFPGKDT